MATTVLSHTVPCAIPGCGLNRTITDNGTYYTVEVCSCGAGDGSDDGAGQAFNLIDIDLATAKPPWKTGKEGIP
jgi:hypothetical protein